MRQNVIIEAVPEDLVHKLTKEKTGDSMQVGLNIKIKRIGSSYIRRYSCFKSGFNPSNRR